MMKINMNQLKEYLETVCPIQRHIVTGDREYVHNVLDTKGEPKPNGFDSFIGFWQSRTSEQGDPMCMAVSPHENADGKDSDLDEVVGAHVRIDDVPCPDDWAWIVPLCKHCNGVDHCILLRPGTVLIPIKMSRPHETAHSKDDVAIKLLRRMNWQ